MLQKVVVLGAGEMSAAITHDLLRSPHIGAITVADVDLKRARRLARRWGDKRLRAAEVDVTRPRPLRALLKGATCVIGATTYAHNLQLTEACIAVGAHFCDLGGNNDVVRAQHRLQASAKRAGVSIVPDCGLAPGLVNVLGYHWAQAFDTVDALEIRVGGLPQKSTNALDYQLAFSVQGLINEYIEPALVVRNGVTEKVDSLTGLETLHFAKPYADMEAFYTSGGTSTLPKTLAGKVRNLDYKTIRYRGHGEKIKLLNDLGLFQGATRQILADALTTYLPVGAPDVVLIRVHVAGQRQGRAARETYDCVDVLDETTGLSAMQRTTGYSIAVIARMLLDGQITQRGVLYQERAVSGEAFLEALGERRIVFSKS